MTHSKSFARSLSDAQMQALREATNDPSHWWRDLLTLWRPSGHQTADDGLRLAIRNGYLNLYRRGQSVARVAFDASGQPTLSVHAKYVVNDHERQLPKLSYARLVDNQLVHRDLPSRPYAGSASLKAWIDVIDQHFTVTDGEKPLIDQLLGVSGNANVVDLEMALPAWGAVKSAPRMDLVTIEDVSGDLTVVFGEVKTIDDGRIRCQAAEGRPKVVEQLGAYKTYLDQPGHCEAIAGAYRSAAARLVELNAMAANVRSDLELGENIVRAARGEALTVAREATLVVVRRGDYSEAHWKRHSERLRDREKIKMVELDASDTMNLGALI